MKKHFPMIASDFDAGQVWTDSRYQSTERRILRWCADNAIVITRIQLETVTLNLPVHLSAIADNAEARPLGLASDPRLPHSLSAQDGEQSCFAVECDPPSDPEEL